MCTACFPAVSELSTCRDFYLFIFWNQQEDPDIHLTASDQMTKCCICVLLALQHWLHICGFVYKNDLQLQNSLSTSVFCYWAAQFALCKLKLHFHSHSVFLSTLFFILWACLLPVALCVSVWFSVEQPVYLIAMKNHILSSAAPSGYSTAKPKLWFPSQRQPTWYRRDPTVSWFWKKQKVLPGKQQNHNRCSALAETLRLCCSALVIRVDHENKECWFCGWDAER